MSIIQRLQLLEKNYIYNKADIAGIILLSTIWGERLLYYVRSVLLRLPIINSIATPFITITIIAVILVTFRYVKNRIKFIDATFVMVVVFVYFSHMLLYPDNEEILTLRMVDYFFTILPFFLLGVICDIDKCIGVLIKISLAYTICGVLYFYYVSSVALTYEMDTRVDQMGIAYQYLPHVLLLLYATLKKFNLFYLTGALLGLLMIVGSGNRGSLLLVVSFVIFYYLFGSQKPLGKGTIIALFFAVLAIANIDVIALMLFDVLGDVGLSVRSLSYILEENFTDDNGRQEIKDLMMKAIGENPFFGYGLCGDRVISKDGSFAHNLLIEMFVSFGIILGSLLFVSLLLLLFRAYRSCISLDQKFFFFLLLCCGFLKLFLSSSFMGEKYFYMLLGYSITVIRDKKLKKVTNESFEHIDSGRILGIFQTSKKWF